MLWCRAAAETRAAESSPTLTTARENDPPDGQNSALKQFFKLTAPRGALRGFLQFEQSFCESWT